MIPFVSLVKFEGRLLAMTETGAVWRFDPGFKNGGIAEDARWTHVSEGPGMGAESLQSFRAAERQSQGKE